MPYNSDKIFNLGWGLVGVMVGVSVLLWSIGIVSGAGAFMVWLLSVGIITLGLGFVRTKEAREGSFTLMAFGAFVVALASGILGAVLDLISLSASIAIIIIVFSLVIALTGIMGSKSKEDNKND